MSFCGVSLSNLTLILDLCTIMLEIAVCCKIMGLNVTDHIGGAGELIYTNLSL